MSIAASKQMEKYFSDLNSEVNKCYSLADSARSKGYDPDKTTSIMLAKDLSERVEGLISVVAPQIRGSGVSERIKELEKEFGMQDWRVALKISEEIAKEKFCKFKTKLEAMEVGIRAGFAYVTVGVVASPLEGFVKLVIKNTADNKEYFSPFYSGPVRSAGGTAGTVSLLIADYVRVKMGYAKYDPTEKEIKRCFAELEHYHDRITNLQYFPSQKESDFIAMNIPLQVDGDPTEKIDVPNYKDLPRIATNKLRGGFCLVFAECLMQKAKKVWNKMKPWAEEFDLGHWNFLEVFLEIQKEAKSKGIVKLKDKGVNVSPDYTYIKDLVAGRPVLGHPLANGAFRLRYGRTRTSGFSSDALHPATLFILNEYIAIGTQLKTERPGKSTVIASCDKIEGPIVKLKDGNVIFIEDIETAKLLSKNVEEILYAGDILINYGDFLDRAHVLLPPGYCEEWWALEFARVISFDDKLIYSEFLKGPLVTKPNCREAFTISKKYNIPLHPKYTYHWSTILSQQVFELLEWFDKAVVKEDKIILPITKNEYSSLKRILELIGAPHRLVNNEYVVLEEDWADALRISLGLYTPGYDIIKIKSKFDSSLSSLDFLNLISEVLIKDKNGYFIGSRMGRPEKAKLRKLTGSPHGLFPVGEEGGRLRCFQAALEKGKVTSQFPIYYCEFCKKYTVYPKCHVCNAESKSKFFCRTCGYIEDKCPHDFIRTYHELKLDIKEYFDSSLKHLGIKDYPELIKGVRGTSNKDHIPEHLSKSILRAIHGIHVNKDGTTRYDMTEMVLTHFKPYEIGSTVEKLRSLGYDKDVYGNILIQDNQIIELKCQDIVLPACHESLEEGADEILFRTANFLDDLLDKFYKVDRFYNLGKKEDLIGHLVVGLSPHTSAGIVCRIIGFSKTQGMLCHPLLHSIMRRDCDGDESGVMLLLDALLNFSPKLLSGHRGATQDEPLVLTSCLIPSEVDDMVFNMDIADSYSLEFYEACSNFKHPSEVKVETLRTRLDTPGQYEGLMFTHDTTNLNDGVRCSKYKLLPTMEEKVFGQMDLAEKLRAVNTSDVARLIIERHFMRDIKGNLRKFSMQQFRCVGCNEKYRRPPLRGVCLNCKGKLIFTISEGSVIKYLEPSLSLAKKYKLPSYLVQTLELTKQRVEMVFGKEKDKQQGLGRWFG